MALTLCAECEGKMSETAESCPHCGFKPKKPETKSDPCGMSAVLSFFIPGLGQMYKGKLGSGLMWMICTVVGYLSFIVPGVILHLICVVNAYECKRAQ